MKKLNSLFFLILALTSFGSAWGAARTLIGAAGAGGGNWSSTNSWLAAATPAVGDTVTAAVTCGPVTIDTTTATCASMVLTGDVSSMNFAAGQTLTVAGGVTFASGMTLSGTGTLDISAAATLLSNGLTFPGSLTFAGAGNTTKTFGDNWTITGNFNDTINSIFNSNVVTIGGGFTNTGNTSGTTAFVLNGSGTMTSGGSFGSPVTINTSGAITLSGAIQLTTNAIFTIVTPANVSTSSFSMSAAGNCSLGLNGIHVSVFSLSASTNLTLTLLTDLLDDSSFTSGVNDTQIVAGNFNISCSNFRVPPGSLSIASGQAVTVTNLVDIEGGFANNQVTLKSGTSSSPFKLIYQGPLANNRIYQAFFTDVDASLSTQPVINYNGSTLTRTTNIINQVLPIPPPGRSF